MSIFPSFTKNIREKALDVAKAASGAIDEATEFCDSWDYENITTRFAEGTIAHLAQITTVKPEKIIRPMFNADALNNLSLLQEDIVQLDAKIKTPDDVIVPGAPAWNQAETSDYSDWYLNTYMPWWYHNVYMPWLSRVRPEQYQINARLAKKVPDHTTKTGKPYDDMDGHEFEHYCAELLRNIGYQNVAVTSASGDFGIDILAEKDSVTYAIRCKCYSSDLGNKCVQEAYSGRDYYKAHVAVVLTNRYFTKAAEETAKGTGVVLWDRDMLNQMAEQCGEPQSS